MLRLFVFFVIDPATSTVYTYLHTLSLHDALPIWGVLGVAFPSRVRHRAHARLRAGARRVAGPGRVRSEAHRGRCRRRAARAPGDAAVRAACASATSPVGAAEAAGL